MVKCPPANAGDIRHLGSIPGLGWFPGGGHANPLQHSCLKNPMDRGAWRATDHRDANGQTRLQWLSKHACRAFPQSISQIWFSLSVVCLCSHAFSFNLCRLCFMAGFRWEKPEQEGKEEAPAYLCSPSGDSPCCEGRSGGGACSSADGHLLLDPISPFPSLLRPDLSSTGRRGLSHLSLRWSHVALLPPRGRHFRAWGHGGCLSLPDK